MRIYTVDGNGLVNGTRTDERRSKTRAKVSQIVYLRFPPENGGILLDISSAGLGFQAADPIAPDKQIHFRFPAESLGDVELVGDLIWLDDSRKRGGLRFGQLPEPTLQHIRKWIDIVSAIPTGASPLLPNALEKPNVLEKAPAEKSAAERQPAFAEMGQASAPGMSEPPVSHDPDPAAPIQEQSQLASSDPAAAPERSQVSQDHPPPIATQREAQKTPFSYATNFGPIGVQALENLDRSSSSRPRVGTILFTVFLAFAVGAGAYAGLHKRDTGELLMHWGQTLSGEHPRESAESAALTPGIPSAVGQESTGAARVPSPTPDTPKGVESSAAPSAQNNTAQSVEDQSAKSPSLVAPGLADSTHPQGQSRSDIPDSLSERGISPLAAKAPDETAGTPASADDGVTELALAEQSLREAGSATDRSAAAHLLWTAVGKGNTQAEVELAELYVRRDGVPGQNCQQARILLKAASDAGNPAARQKLADLGTYGCK